MTRLCPKCRQVSATETVARGDGFTFERCANGCLSFARVQTRRGSVSRAGLIEESSEASGEFDGRVMHEPSWYPAALMRGAQ